MGFSIPEHQRRSVVKAVLEERLSIDLQRPFWPTEPVVDKRVAFVVDGLISGCVKHGVPVKIRHQCRLRPIRHGQGARPVLKSERGRTGVAQFEPVKVRTRQLRWSVAIRVLGGERTPEERRAGGGQHEKGQQHDGDKTTCLHVEASKTT